MSLEFVFLLNVVLVTRLSLTFLDGAVDRRRMVAMTVVQLLALLAYTLEPALAVLAVLLALLNALFHLHEVRTGRVNLSRLVSLVTYVLALSVFTSPWVGLRFNPGLANALGSLGEYSLLLSGWDQVDWLEVHTVLLGFLLVTNEANLLIRYIIQRYLLQPGRPSGQEDQPAVRLGFLERVMISIRAFGYLFQPGLPAPRDEAGADESAGAVIGLQEYNTGRIIGILERVLIYALVLNEQYAAIGLILAAKSFTRYKELENRAFAEYVLVGTLLSTLLAVLVAEMVQLLLG